MKQLLRSKRAVSTVLSTVLMILIVVAGMSLLFGFFVNYAGDFQRGSGSAVLESMVVEDVNFLDSQHAEIWVYNLGKVGFNISFVYVNGALYKDNNPPSLLRVTYKGVDVTAAASDKIIRDGAHCKIEVTSSFINGGIYTFKIITARGSSVEVKEEYL
jgi:FlaG/FlaF family flagellin (archaellin)